MLQETEKLGINLIQTEEPGVESNSFQKHEFQNLKHEVLGHGEESFLVLSTPLKASYHEQDENFPNTELENSTLTFLAAGKNSETKKWNEFLIVFKQLKTGNITFTDQRPLEDFTNLLAKETEKKRKESCSYKVSQGKQILAFDNWIVGEKRHNVSNVGVENSKHVYLKEVTQKDYDDILRVNKAPINNQMSPF